MLAWKISILVPVAGISTSCLDPNVVLHSCTLVLHTFFIWWPGQVILIVFPYMVHNTVTKCLCVCSNEAFASGVMSQFLQGVQCSHLNLFATSYLSCMWEPPTRSATSNTTLAIKNAISWTHQLTTVLNTTHIKSLSLAMTLLYMDYCTATTKWMNAFSHPISYHISWQFSNF